MTRPGREPTSYRVRGGHANHLATPQSSGIGSKPVQSPDLLILQYFANTIVILSRGANKRYCLSACTGVG